MENQRSHRTDVGLPVEEERRLAQIVRAGHRDERGRLACPRAIEARDKLVVSNQGLVRKIARGFQGRGMDLEDLEQWGFFGLIEGVEKFDPEKFDTRLSTYASHYIRMRMRRGLLNDRTLIRIPVYCQDEMYKRAKGKPYRLCDDFIDAAERAMAFYGNKGDSVVLMASIVAPKEPDPGLEEDDSRLLPSLMETLTDREREVIRRRMGFDESPQTLQQIGDSLGLSRERVRVIEREALSKLRGEMIHDKSIEHEGLPKPIAKRQKGPGKSGYIGVALMPTGRFQAQISYKGSNKSLGTFVLAKEAAKARDDGALRLVGPNAVLNFPQAHKRKREAVTA